MPEDGIKRHHLTPFHLVLTHEQPLLSIQHSFLRIPEKASSFAHSHSKSQEDSIMEDIDGPQLKRNTGQQVNGPNSAAALSLDKFPRLTFAIHLKGTIKASVLNG